MNNQKNIKSIRQVTFKYKIISFIAFYVFLNTLAFGYMHELLNMKAIASYVNDVYVDGASFTSVINLFVGGFNGVMFLISIIFNSVINLLLILLCIKIFIKMYSKTICAEKEKLSNYIKKIIWIMPVVWVLLNIYLNINHRIEYIIIIITMIYLPLPILTQALFLKKLYK